MQELLKKLEIKDRCHAEKEEYVEAIHTLLDMCWDHVTIDFVYAYLLFQAKKCDMEG